MARTASKIVDHPPPSVSMSLPMRRALMIRMASPRSTNDTTMRRPAQDSPRINSRVSRSVWPGSGVILASGSGATVFATPRQQDDLGIVRSRTPRSVPPRRAGPLSPAPDSLFPPSSSVGQL